MQDGEEVGNDEQPGASTAEPTAAPTTGPTTGPAANKQQPLPAGPGKGPVSVALPASGKKPAPKKGEEKKGEDKKQDFKAAAVGKSEGTWAGNMQGLINDHIMGDHGVMAGMDALKDAIKNKMDENNDKQAKGGPDKAQAPGKGQVVVKTPAASASPPPPANNAGGSATQVGNSVDTASPPPVTTGDDAAAVTMSSGPDTVSQDEMAALQTSTQEADEFVAAQGNSDTGVTKLGKAGPQQGPQPGQDAGEDADEDDALSNAM